MIPITDLANKPNAVSHKVALIIEKNQWTYQQLQADVNRVATNLYTDGYRSGDRILICLENGYEIVISVLACFKIGLIVVQAYTDYSKAELSYIAENSQFTGIISSKFLYPKLEKTQNIRSTYLTEITEPDQENLPFSHLLRAPVKPLPSLQIDPQQPILISYTSGTTAKRKGVIQTYHSIASTIESVTKSFLPSIFERPLIFSSLANNGAFMILVLPSFWLNGTVIVTIDGRPETVLKAIQKEQPTFFFTFPFFLKQIIHHPQAQKTDFSSLKVVLVGGDVVTKELYEQFSKLTNLPLSQGFGMTESHSSIMNLAHDPSKIGSLGLPAYGVEAKIIDDQGHEVPPGVSGQLLIKREAITPGYWNFPEETAKAIQHGWLYTGDLAMKDADGYYWFQGRIKNIIVRDAENISPIEVEEAICKHPAVRAAGVIGIPDPEWGQAVKAYVELQGLLTTEELQTFLTDFLSPYKIPTEIVFVSKLPRTLTGKIDRKNLINL